MNKSRIKQGVTLIELALVILIIGVLAALVSPRLLNMFDDADAETINSLKSSLEMAISEGLGRGLPLSQLVTPGGGGDQRLDEIAGLVNTGLPPSVVVTAPAANQVLVTITGTNGPPKTATMVIQNNGSVDITAITNFTRYQIVNGNLERI